MVLPDSLADLTLRWREEAKVLRRRGAVAQGEVLEGCAAELEEAVTACEDEVLTVAEAADDTGYSEETVRRWVRSGQLPAERNSGTRSHIRLRRGDLPRKPRPVGRTGGTNSDVSTDYNPEEDARDIAQRLGR